MRAGLHSKTVTLKNNICYCCVFMLSAGILLAGFLKNIFLWGTTYGKTLIVLVENSAFWDNMVYVRCC